MINIFQWRIQGLSITQYYFIRFSTRSHLLMRGILLAQLLKDPERYTSFPSPFQRKTVGRSRVGALSSDSKSCRQARNSSFSKGAWNTNHNQGKTIVYLQWLEFQEIYRAQREQGDFTLMSSPWKISASSGLSIRIFGLSPSLMPRLSLRWAFSPWPIAALSLLVFPMALSLSRLIQGHCK